MSNDDSSPRPHYLNIIDKTKIQMSKYLKHTYCSTPTSYNKLFINQLLNPLTTLHKTYTEILIIMDTKDFLIKYYLIGDSFRKMNFLSTLNALLIKPFPNFLGMNLMYNLMQQNLKSKQSILNSYFKIVNEIKKEISSNDEKFLFFKNYKNELSHIIETKKPSMNDCATRFNSTPQDKEESILLIENIIKCIDRTTKNKRFFFDNGYNVNRIRNDLNIKFYSQINRKNEENDTNEKKMRISALRKKNIGNKKGYIKTNCSKTRNENNLLFKGSPLKFRNISSILMDSDNNSKSKEFSSSHKKHILLNTYENMKNNHHFLKTKVFVERLKNKKLKQIKLLKTPLIGNNTYVSATKSRNNNTSQFSYSKTFYTEKSFQRKVHFSSEKSNSINRTLCQHDQVRRTLQFNIPQQGSTNKMDISKSQCKQNYPTKLTINKSQLAHRNIRSSILNKNNMQYSFQFKNNHISNNTSHNFLTNSVFSDSTELNQFNTIKARSSNYYLYRNNQKCVKKFAIFLRKDYSK